MDFALNIENGEAALDLGYTGDVVLLEEGTTNLCAITEIRDVPNGYLAGWFPGMLQAGVVYTMTCLGRAATDGNAAFQIVADMMPTSGDLINEIYQLPVGADYGKYSKTFLSTKNQSLGIYCNQFLISGGEVLNFQVEAKSHATNFTIGTRADRYGIDAATVRTGKATSIINNVYLSLSIERGAFFANPDFGSRLHLLKRSKNTARTERLARDYSLEALQWLLDTGRATSINVYTERDRRLDLNRLKLQVEVTQADGRKVSFEKFLEVV